MARVDLAGLRILVVEDEFLVSLEIEITLTEQHCTIVGPFDRVADALEAARTVELDAAILDVNVAGVKVYPVAEALAGRAIPFIFLSGYGRHALPREHPEWRVCSKPYRPEDLVSMLRDQIEGIASGS